jgi:hypothetical protein
MGCTTQKKAVRWMNEHPVVLAELCNDQYPVKETFVKGQTIYETDTLIEPGLIIQADPILLKVKCPPSKTIKVIERRTDTIMKENTAKLRLVLNDLSNLNTEVETERKRTQAANSRFVWAICLGLVGIVAARIFKF